jgi:methionine-rich copper-binding protein CopC
MRTPHIIAISIVLCAALAAVVIGTSTASAHARYKSSTPGKGEVLAASPASVTINFTQDVQKITGTYGIDVLDAAGANVTAGPPALNDNDRSQMTVPLQPSLPPGRYVVEWKNISDADGDPFAAAFAFYVGTEPTEADVAADRVLAEEEGAEETPSVEAATPSPVVGTAVSASPQATSTRAAAAGNDDDGGNDSAVWFIIIGGVIAGAAIGFGGYRFFQRNRRG